MKLSIITAALLSISVSAKNIPAHKRACTSFYPNGDTKNRFTVQFQNKKNTTMSFSFYTNSYENGEKQRNKFLYTYEGKLSKIGVEEGYKSYEGKLTKLNGIAFVSKDGYDTNYNYSHNVNNVYGKVRYKFTRSSYSMAIKIYRKIKSNFKLITTKNLTCNH